MADSHGIATFNAGGNQSDTHRQVAYQICKTRGHESNGSFTSNAVPNALAWYKCVHCGTDYAHTTTTVLHEKNAPKQEPEL